MLYESTSNKPVQEAMAQLRTCIENYFPNLWPAVDLGVATCATLFLQDNSNPVAVIYVGPPSSSKTTVAQMFADAHVQGELFCYVSDDFTPAAFVSHAANREREDLANIDLLPKIRHRVLITPELATIFRGKEEELTKIFRTLTRVLDGQGLMRDSGTHGRRGYQGDYVFAWLGCTTPFSDNVWKVMAQLGSRLFFLVMHQQQTVTLDELIHPTNTMPFHTRLQACRKQVHRMLEVLGQQYGAVRKLAWDSDNDPTECKEWIGRCSMLIATMRGHLAMGHASTLEEQNGIAPTGEAPYRAYAVLYNLARGHALAHGRLFLTCDDLPLIAHVTASTMPTRFAYVFQALIRKDNQQLTCAEVQQAMAVKSPATARTVMNQLDATGVMKHCAKGQGQTAYLQFHDEWAWCGSTAFRAIVRGTLSPS